jgi:hypothetical protein
MMPRKRKKIFISNSPNRALVSDVLPYELPITFSNRNFYRFIEDNKIKISDSKIEWGINSPHFKYLIKLLFGLNDPALIANETDTSIGFHSKALTTVPFEYKISHKENDFRTLTLIHPKNQVTVVNLYHKYSDLILYYSSISDFSIRYPYRVARYYYHKDKTFFKHLAFDHEHHVPEDANREYVSLKTFFSYKDISNIYKFYESYRYHRCEKKYNKLYKFDISKCFDSIYTHSIAWSLLDKESVKYNLHDSKKTFAGEFDKVMQNLNYGETNGIVIGPEVSRIFAELIFQKIDNSVLQQLKIKSPNSYHKKDFEAFRYVDDIFLFYNDENILINFLKIYKLELKKYGLYVNDSKSIFYEKPLITNISRAKIKVVKLIDEKIKIKLESIDPDSEDEENKKKFILYVSSSKLITEYKIVLKESEVGYKDVINYTLGCLERKFISFLKKYSIAKEKKKQKNKVFKFCISLIDFAFFLYSVNPKVNTTIKLSLLLSKMIKFIRTENSLDYDNSHSLLKKVYDEIFFILNKHKLNEHTQIETLYLLIILKQLGKSYRLGEDFLCKHIGIDLENKQCLNDLNYFSITTILFYIGNIKRYKKCKKTVLFPNGATKRK